MATLSITEANVNLATDVNVSVDIVQLGETITRGQVLYVDANNKYWRADATSIPNAVVAGIALTGGVADDYIVLVVAGEYKVGATVAVGTAYVLSGAAGSIELESDLTDAAEYVTWLGYAVTTTSIFVGINATGVVA